MSTQLSIAKAGTAIIAGGILITVLSASFGSMVTVSAGHRAAIFNMFKGVEHHTMDEGTHFIVPFIQSPTFYDVRTQTYTMSAFHDEGDKKGDDAIYALSSDGQTVKMDVTVRYHLDPDAVWEVHQQVGPDYVEKIIRPEAQTVVRNSVAKNTVTELYSVNRQKIASVMSEQLEQSMKKYHIILDELLVRNVSFSEQFSQAIEQKQVALQDAERMKYVLLKEEAEKNRKIIAATGEAEAMRRRGQALRENPQLVRYEYVQKLSPNVKVVIADQKTLVNLGDLVKDSSAEPDANAAAGHAHPNK
jgi:regulator of protease activity HflC (stomatin/prohibitin superfamily)